MTDVQNLYKVPQRQWKRWNWLAQHVFNQTYGGMTRSIDLFVHPKAPKVDPKHFDTTAWNAAWTAADAVMGRDAVKERA